MQLLCIVGSVRADSHSWVAATDTRFVLNQQDNSAVDTVKPHRRYNLWKDFANVGRNMGSDAFRIYSSPTRINGNCLLILGGVLAVGGVIYAYDQEILDAFQRNRNHKLYKPIRKLGERFERWGYMGASNKYVAGALALSYLLRWDKGVAICSDVLESHWIAGGAKNLVNLAAGRARPFEGRGPRFFKWNQGTSFPSGHSSCIVQMAVAFFTSHRLPAF